MVTSSSRLQAGEGCGGGSCADYDGRVFVLPDRDADSVADRIVVFADGLNRPVDPQRSRHRYTAAAGCHFAWG
jgi:hypothetical protein